MEFKIEKYEKPDIIAFNYEELKSELKAKVDYYGNIAYAEDQIKEAKADKASLNRLKKALNDERIRIQREYMAPFDDFKSKVDELIKIIDEPVSVIDKQVKNFEEKRKQEKEEKIREKFDEINTLDFLEIEKVWNLKWLNASYSMPKITEEIEETISKIKKEMQTLAGLAEYSFEALEFYKQTLDISAALSRAKELAELQKKKEEEEKRKAEAEAKRKEETQKAEAVEEANKFCQSNPPKEPTPEPVVQEPVPEVGEWVRFEAFLTVEQAKDLKWFFDTKRIEFRKI